MDSALSFRVTADPDDRSSLSRLTGESGDVAADPQRALTGLTALLQLRRLEVRLIGALVGG